MSALVDDRFSYLLLHSLHGSMLFGLKHLKRVWPFSSLLATTHPGAREEELRMQVFEDLSLHTV